MMTILRFPPTNHLCLKELFEWSSQGFQGRVPKWDSPKEDHAGTIPNWRSLTRISRSGIQVKISPRGSSQGNSQVRWRSIEEQSSDDDQTKNNRVTITNRNWYVNPNCTELDIENVTASGLKAIPRLPSSCWRNRWWFDDLVVQMEWSLIEILLSLIRLWCRVMEQGRWKGYSLK